MAGWGKETDANQNGNDNFAANNVPYKFKDSAEPFGAGTTTKRNVIATPRGWVRRNTYYDTHGNARIKDEILVAGDSFDNGNPYITEIYLSANTTGGVTTANSANVYVVFSEPVFHGGDSSDLTIVATQGGNTVTFTANNGNGLTDIVNANNTIVFTASSIFSGVYKINSQSIGNTSNFANLISLNTGNASANLTVSGAVSNALGTFIL